MDICKLEKRIKHPKKSMQFMKDKFSKSWYFRGFEELNFDDNVEFNDLNEFLDTQITKINNVFEGVEGEVRGEE